MKVNYTLPGLLPESARTPAAEGGEHTAEPFGARLQRLRAPETTDWRTLLRLNAPPAWGADPGPPPPPQGIDSRDGASRRAWWRAALGKHTSLPASSSQGPAAGAGVDAQPPVQRMLGLLRESQRLEEQIFARHFAEGGD